jgi:hypothetical protein
VLGRFIVGVGDPFAPARLGRVGAITLHEDEVGHEAVRGGAMPVLLVWSGVDGVAGVRFDDRAVAAAEQGGACEDVQGLAQAVGVPVGTGAGREPDDVRAGPTGLRSGVD